MSFNWLSDSNPKCWFNSHKLLIEFRTSLKCVACITTNAWLCYYNYYQCAQCSWGSQKSGLSKSVKLLKLYKWPVVDHVRIRPTLVYPIHPPLAQNMCSSQTTSAQKFPKLLLIDFPKILLSHFDGFPNRATLMSRLTIRRWMEIWKTNSFRVVNGLMCWCASKQSVSLDIHNSAKWKFMVMRLLLSMQICCGVNWILVIIIMNGSFKMSFDNI